MKSIIDEAFDPMIRQFRYSAKQDDDLEFRSFAERHVKELEHIKHQLIESIRKLRDTTPIDQVFMESVPCSTYRKEDGSFDDAQLIIDVWRSACDNIIESECQEVQET